MNLIYNYLIIHLCYTLESPLSVIDYTEDMKSSSMDATAPSAREIGHIVVSAATSSIMAGLGTYDAPSSDSDSSGVSDAAQKRRQS